MPKPKKKGRRAVGYGHWPEMDKNGAKARSQLNIEYFLEQREISLSFNELSHEAILKRRGSSKPIEEAAFNALFLEADRLGLQAQDGYFLRVIENIARRNSFHPLRSYLSRAQKEWDGTDRLNEWLHAYAGAENTALNQAFGRKHLIAAVRRIRQSGVKYDTMLTMEGYQGAGKSSLIQALSPEPHYFTDSLVIGSDDKKVIELTAGKWLVEFAELDGMTKKEAGTIKHFISRQKDCARLSYARGYASERPRQFVLFGTCNESQYLRDPTATGASGR